MGLYDDRLSELSEPRHGRRVAQRRSSSLRPSAGRPTAPVARISEAATKPQSLLFDRASGWTVNKSKTWAKSHGYKHGSVDVTDQYIRLRQFDPKGFKIKRTVPFGRGIRAVVAREESMLTTTAREAPRRHRASKKKKATSSKRPRRHAKKVTAVATRRRHRKVKAAKRSSHMMEASKKRRTKRRPARASEAWKGDSAGHAKAARKGHRRSKARKSRKAGRRRSKKTRETMYAAAPKRRRHAKRRTREPMVMEAKRSRRRSHRNSEAKRSGRGNAMGPAEFGIAIVSAGLGFVLADGLDRMLATYDPTAKDKPTDKFTSDGAGTLANTLNVAAAPSWQRVVASIAVTAAPAVGSMYIKNPMLKSSAEGLAIGAGVSLFKTLWSNVLMPMLVGKDTSVDALKKSYIARLYPAEVAARINSRKTNDAGAAVTPQMAVSSTGSGALSAPPEQQMYYPPTAGVGAPTPDVGPFALAGSSDYPSAAEALRNAAGVGASASGGLLPTVQHQWGTGGSAAGGILPTAAQAMGTGGSAAGGILPTAAQAMGMGAAYMPGPPPGPGPGPNIERGSDPAACGCIGDDNQFLGFVGDEAADGTLASSTM
jgi:hypothetical protein